MLVVIAAIFWVVTVFALIVIIHEGGHYFFARLFDIEVEEFCVGIGPKLWGRKKGKTFYGICLFPIGGYVKVAGMDPSDEPTERGFNVQPPWKRYWVIMGGPLFNFIAAVLLICAFGFFGYPKNMVLVGYIVPDGPADIAGFQSFDEITALDRMPVRSARFLQHVVSKSAGKELAITLRRQKETIEVKATPRIINDFNPGKASLGITLAVASELLNTVSGVLPNSPAFKAGFRVGDVITSVNGKPVASGGELMEKVDRLGRTAETPPADNPESILVPVLVGLTRDGTPLTITVTPEFNSQIGENIAFIGLTFNPVLVKLPFDEAMATTWDYMRNILYSMVDGLKSLFTTPTENLVGPVGIANMIAQSAKAGAYQLLIIAILLNINLGLINLFPIPALDGGRLVFISLEGLFKVKINEHKEAIVHLVGFVMLIGLILMITYREIFGPFQ
jgi:regulator of sigma E protease